MRAEAGGDLAGSLWRERVEIPQVLPAQNRFYLTVSHLAVFYLTVYPQQRGQPLSGIKRRGRGQEERERDRERERETELPPPLSMTQTALTLSRSLALSLALSPSPSHTPLILVRAHHGNMARRAAVIEIPNFPGSIRTSSKPQNPTELHPDIPRYRRSRRSVRRPCLERGSRACSRHTWFWG